MSIASTSTECVREPDDLDDDPHAEDIEAELLDSEQGNQVCGLLFEGNEAEARRIYDSLSVELEAPADVADHVFAEFKTLAATADANDSRRTLEQIGRDMYWRFGEQERVADLLRQSKVHCAKMVMLVKHEELSLAELTAVTDSIQEHVSLAPVDLVEISHKDVVLEVRGRHGEEIIKPGENYLMRYRDQFWAETPQRRSGRKAVQVAVQNRKLIDLSEVDQIWRIVSRKTASSVS